VNPPLAERSIIRMDARLDVATRQKVDELATRFHQPRAAVLCHIMQWGMSHGRTGLNDDDASQGPVRHFHLHVASELYERVEKAATAAGANIAPWVRHMVRQISIADFPASWREEQPAVRSHDSREFDVRFMLRLNHITSHKLQDLVDHFRVSKAAIIRQLIVQATPEDFPQSWHMSVGSQGRRLTGSTRSHGQR
jgi:hypothetical protein